MMMAVFVLPLNFIRLGNMANTIGWIYSSVTILWKLLNWTR